jgi:hypothetical protein
VAEFNGEIARLESSFRDKLPDDTMLAYYSALCDRNQHDLSLAVTEVIASEHGARVPNIATIKMHLSHVILGYYCD